MRPHVEVRQTGGATYLLAHGMSVGSYEEQARVVQSPVYVPVAEGAGKLIPIGGAANEGNFKLLSRHVVEGTGVTVITFPTEIPEKRFDDVKGPLVNQRVRGAVFHLRHDLLPDIGEMMIKRSSLVFITGGNQVRGKQMLEETRLKDVVLDSLKAGKTVAGTSAGAHLMGRMMPFEDKVVNGSGFTSLGIDTHFRQLNRYSRQEGFVEQTGEISLGLDEATGIIYQNGLGSVIGDGEAVVRYHNGVMEEPIRLREGDIFDFRALGSYVDSFKVAA